LSVSVFSVKHHSKSSYLNSQDPNEELFTSVSFLSGFLSTSGIDPTARFERRNLYGILFLSFFLWNEFYLVLSSKLQLICIIIYLIFIIYFMWNEIHSLFKFKFNYWQMSEFIFSQTLKYAGRDWISFTMIFSVIFVFSMFYLIQKFGLVQLYNKPRKCYLKWHY
jgi:hypothetical protein